MNGEHEKPSIHDMGGQHLSIEHGPQIYNGLFEGWTLGSRMRVFHELQVYIDRSKKIGRYMVDR